MQQKLSYYTGARLPVSVKKHLTPTWYCFFDMQCDVLLSYILPCRMYRLYGRTGQIMGLHHQNDVERVDARVAETVSLKVVNERFIRYITETSL